MNTIDLSALGTFVNELTTPIYTESVLGSNFLSYCTHQEGIKEQAKIAFLEGKVSVSSPSCGIIPVGATGPKEFQNTIATSLCAITQTLCEEDFSRTYLGMYQKIGAANPDGNIPELFASAYMTQMANLSKAKIEDLSIKGSSGAEFSSDADLIQVTGILKTLTLTTASQSLAGNIFGATAGGTTGTGLTNKYTETNAQAWIKNLISYQHADTYEDESNRLYLSIPDYRTYVNSWLYSATPNYFVNLVDGSGKMKRELIIPGTDIIMTATRGFNNITGTYTKYFMLTPSWNIVYGYDGLQDSTKPLFMYDEFTRTSLYRLIWRMGMGAIYYKYIVIGRTN